MKYVIQTNNEHNRNKEHFAYAIYELDKLHDTSFDYLVDVGKCVFGMYEPWRDTLASGRLSYELVNTFINDTIEECYRVIIEDLFSRIKVL